MGLTKEQQLVVDTRGKNMLVAAAAGSGKTRVLVERIISEILDEKNPIDVDRILVVTFTVAAAAEMKERVRKAIDNKLFEEPNRADLRRQATLVHNAQIRTIDSFCSWVVKNYFYEINLEPSFRIATSGEMDLLVDEVLDELIAEKLEAREEGFKLLADAYIDGKKVDKLKSMIKELHSKAFSNPWPLEWYDEAVAIYNINSKEELAKSNLIKTIMEDAKNEAAVWAKAMEYAIGLYPVGYEKNDLKILEAEKSCFERLIKAENFDEMYEIFSSMVFVNFRANEKELGPDVKARVKDTRDLCKKKFGVAKEKFFSQNLEDLFDEIIYIGKMANTLISVAKEYDERLSEKKKKKNIYDFNDIEHMALEILRDKDDINHSKRPVALELSQYFSEVMCDEYQDSNQLQEAILTAVCREDNYFTVGDVKQSIYSFRQASPDLFNEKFRNYSMDEKSPAKDLRIDLDKNFRSRGEVLEFCNRVFYPMMQEDMGGVNYDEAASLKVGATNYPKGDKFSTEIYIAEYDKEQTKELAIKNSDEFEARIVANRIQRLFSEGFLVSEDDKNNPGEKCSRPIHYNDIVILLRATTGHADTFLKVLKDYDIPCFLESETGFFNRDEIGTLLAMLEVVDNPYNDIPLAAVLHSDMFDFSSQELAAIRAKYKDETFYNCLFKYAFDNPEDKKVANFIYVLDELRDAAIDTPIHDMIALILDKTGFEKKILSKPMGDVAIANINKLKDEAISFESTSYQGLARFVSYINDLKTYEEELGLAKTVSENDDAVRIMTIHKSKGLEFPVVFLSRAAGDYNEKEDIIYHESLGYGLDYKNPDTRVTHTSLIANVIREKTKLSSRGEEQRILYVALTRPKEKLIITGSIAPTQKQTVDDKLQLLMGKKSPVSLSIKSDIKNYLDQIIMGLNVVGEGYPFKIVRAGDLIMNEAKDLAARLLIKENLNQLLLGVDESKADGLIESHAFVYPNKTEINYKSKYSVSEIKHKAIEDFYEYNAAAKPLFVSENQDSEPNRGAKYGTAMHRFMECFDFARDDYFESFDEQLKYMKNSHAVLEEEYELLSFNRLKEFIKSDLGKRMHLAAAKDDLYKEQPFVFMATPKELFGDEHTDSENVLVQGIIDVFFEEDGKIILLDYKTDKVDSKEELVVRYEKQLRLYEDAIAKAYDAVIGDVLIYSFSLNETISLGV